ncbi:MAG TPA: multicopper oxidase domain-containing protein [Nitrososphaerales archaeon]|nr:multicopper oxidase domain-containing protein [Nitrososphaerales archaeon]
MSSVQALTVFLVLFMAAGSVVYLDTTQNLSSQISSLQSEVNSLHAEGATASLTNITYTQAPSSTTARLAPAVRRIVLVAEPAKITIATNVTYDAWTFNGTVPGPTITANQGDTINFTLINDFTDMSHSIDFHAAQVDWSTDYAEVPPGGSKSFTFTVSYPGVFMYHCGSQPVLEHISNGMYGAIIVNPNPPLPQATGGQYVLVQSEFYTNSRPGTDGAFAGNYSEMLASTPNYVVFNGRAFQYQKAPLQVLPNQLVRLYILNVGPDHWSAFHVIGALMDTVYVDGDPSNVMHGLQTLNIPPSGGAIVDMYFRDPGGKNPFVTHDFADASKGAVGMFAVGGGSPGSSTTTTSTTAATTAAPAASVQVRIPPGAGADTSSFGYSPATITVVIGVNNTVVWTNDDNMPHTVTSVNKIFDSGNLNPGDTYSFTFTTPGTYQYGCSYHLWMKGTVIVRAA